MRVRVCVAVNTRVSVEECEFGCVFVCGCGCACICVDDCTMFVCMIRSK